MKSGCNRLVCRNGNYMAEAPDGRLGFEDEGYLSLFGDDDIFVESNMIKLRSQNPAAYAVTQEQEGLPFSACPEKKEFLIQWSVLKCSIVTVNGPIKTLPC